MHQKYLQRLLKEVPIDGIEVDDMGNYPEPTTCGCKYCRERFKKDYGHEIPPFDEKSFWSIQPRKLWNGAIMKTLFSGIGCA